MTSLPNTKLVSHGLVAIKYSALPDSSGYEMRENPGEMF